MPLRSAFPPRRNCAEGRNCQRIEIAALKQEGERNKAYHQAIRFLGVRPRSIAEVTRKLKEKEHDTLLIEAVIQRLSDAGYVDDAAFARFWVEDRTRFRPRSAHALRYELRQKGVAPAVIDEAVADLDEESAAWDAATRQAGWLAQAGRGAVPQKSDRLSQPTRIQLWNRPRHSRSCLGCRCRESRMARKGRERWIRPISIQFRIHNRVHGFHIKLLRQKAIDLLDVWLRIQDHAIVVNVQHVHIGLSFEPLVDGLRDA